MYDPKVEVYPYCWLSQQQSFKKQFRSTRSLCTSRHSFPYLPWRKGSWDGRDTTSFLPEHLAQKGTEVLCSQCHLPCVTMPVGRAREQLCTDSSADAPRADQGVCCKHQQKVQSSLRGSQIPAQTPEYREGRQKERSLQICLLNYFVSYLNNKISPENYLSLD